ncbi:hypothetical protein HWQ18_07045 [Enterobacter ludwigii]|uniref:hypothetical protein n=1 Tax=Enterobacter ludwigii TaxID=299767 RepID=UPI00159C20A8|nr:hypothetical protein [Enterobacter ludwigii]QLA06275.1 hypothetical protein HWQ18_07045 [Enterobacter ludwigii]
MLLSFMFDLTSPQKGFKACSRQTGVNILPNAWKRELNGLPPSLAEVIHLIRNCCDSAPSFITEETRLVSALGFSGEDIEDLFHDAELRFGVRFPSDEEALRQLFSLQHNQSLFSHKESMTILPHWLLHLFPGLPVSVQADISVGDFYRGLNTLFLNGGVM